MCYKNVIFDVGGVLLDWKPMKLLTAMFDEKKAVLLKKNMMDTEYWAELDRGSLSLDQAVELFSKNIPELKKEIKFALKGFIDYLPVIEENVEIIYKLFEDNYRLFVLSNFHSESFNKAYNKYDFFKMFEGLIISSHVKMIKPEKEIYCYILNEYKLNPVETVFFDDSEENVKTALDLNIVGVHTPTSRELRTFYNNHLKRVR
jgi:putative hydrolase of the HAD superfamily